ncbi:acyl carrier protein [Companilactobacillus sp. RD055328]|uniref:acyl carrier protein n=1 Tax=Companilactobacillus sp. RD055328 TaxID=2916634 RepID=UPI001FC8A6D7|nr:acyl carrier protein [Companilactobacillus sp. RD055328]GKQ42575.1 acyl carrier protein [Companilactobacillus sp. RD055328]
MSEEQIMEKIVGLVSDRFDIPADQITANTNFKDNLDADSIDLVEFTLELEDEFGNEISDEDAEKIKTVGEAVAYINSNQ